MVPKFLMISRPNPSISAPEPTYLGMRTPVLLGMGTAGVLTADALHPDPLVQALLGAIAFAVLFALTARGDASERRAAWACVAIATGVELFGSILWGVYRYRLHNVPLYVPPGHGLVYLMAFRLARTRLFAARPQRTVKLSVTLAMLFAVAGLTLEPLLLHRIDVFGAFWCVYFVTFSLRTSRGPFFAAVFVVTSLLEIWGTVAGDWTWLAVDPALGIGSGNPPSVIAGGYCVIEAMVILATRLGGRIAGRGTASASRSVSSTYPSRSLGVDRLL